MDSNNINGLFTYRDESLYKSTDFSKDGVVKQLQAATEGNGIDIVLMGDGYSDRLIADGTFENTMKTVMENIFTEEPYKSFRNYFNVYMVTAVSTIEVYNAITESTTAFGCFFGGGTYVGGDSEKVLSYAQKALSDTRMDEALIIVMLHSESNYGGTCHMFAPTTEGNWGNGVSISYFPVGTTETRLSEVLNHEACGHGFAKLADEYAYEYNGAFPSEHIVDVRALQDIGRYKNVDFTNDRSQILWKHFLDDPRYANEGLGAFEGGLTYWTGVWRATENSIMRDNTGGFNAPSREAIYYRIHKLAYGANWEYNYEAFTDWDAKNRKGAATRGVPYRTETPEDFVPNHPPVIIPHTWREEMNK